MEIKQVIVQHFMQNNALQKEYDSKQNFEDKLSFLYEILRKTNGDRLKHFGNDFFENNRLEQIKTKLNQQQNLDELSFLNFVNENLISNVLGGHIGVEVTTSKETPKVLEENATQNEENDIEKSQAEKSKNITFDKLSKDTLYIKIGSFSKKYLEEAKQSFEQIYSTLKDENINNIVFDIRGNNGGTDEYFKYLSKFTNKDILEKSTYKNGISGEIETFENVLIKGDSQAKNYNNILLVDKACFSTADCLARNAKSSGFATLIGEQTSGEGFGLTPFKIDVSSTLKGKKVGERVIKNMFLKFPVEIPVNQRGEIDFKDYQTTPNIKCDGKEALNVAINFLEKQKDVEVER